MVIGDLGSASLFRNRSTVMRTADENAKHLVTVDGLIQRMCWRPWPWLGIGENVVSRGHFLSQGQGSHRAFTAPFSRLVSFSRGPPARVSMSSAAKASSEHKHRIRGLCSNVLRTIAPGLVADTPGQSVGAGLTSIITTLSSGDTAIRSSREPVRDWLTIIQF